MSERTIGAPDRDHVIEHLVSVLNDNRWLGEYAVAEAIEKSLRQKRWIKPYGLSVQGKSVVVVGPDMVVLDRARAERLIAAAGKLRRFARSILSYGGSVPEASALTDDDLAPLA